MAKIKSGELVGAQGKVGSVVYQKSASGDTVARRYVIPKNPKTLAQRFQRVITKTVGENYKKMKLICDHSFEGRSMGYACANRFRSLNAVRFRERAAYLQAQGISLYEYFNFIGIGSTKYAPAAVFVSEGSLQQVYTSIAGGKLVLAGVAENTYKAIMDACHAQRGDQMTFVTVEKNANNDYTFQFARVILDPRQNNGAAALTVAFLGENNAINCPNQRNNGNFAAIAINGTNLEVKLTSGTVVAAGIIMSRKSGQTWLRSTCQLALSEEGLGEDALSLMQAAEEGDSPAYIDIDSEQYLNNAGVGGVEGSSSAPTQDPDTPQLSNTASINGASQSITGGSVAVTSLTSVALNGSNLSGVTFKMKKNDGADVAPTTSGDSQVAWTISEATVGDQFKFYMDGVLKLTVNVIQSGGSSGGSDFN